MIAFGKGGALETGRGLHEEDPTGVFFHEQTVDGLSQAIATFEQNESRFDPEKTRAHALTFDREVFRRRIKEHVEGYYATYRAQQG